VNEPSALRLTVPPAMLETIAELVAPLVAERLAELDVDGARSEPDYLTVAEAAERLRASRQRVYDLLSSRRLRRFKDGSRVLVSRAELDAYLAGGRPSVPSGGVLPKRRQRG
jgi:excisionase family DNA binding protein